MVGPSKCRGRTRTTATTRWNETNIADANLVLGYINPDFFLGGRRAVDISLSEKAIKQHLSLIPGLTIMRLPMVFSA